jgi:OmpA-OmpF porin, OOP family
MMTRILSRLFAVLILTTLFSVAVNGQPQSQKSPVDKMLKKADAAFASNDFLKASDLYQQVLAADPNQYHSIYRMATISNMIQDYREAQRWYKKAIETDPDRNDTAYLELGLVYKRLNNYMKAKETFLSFQRKHENKEDEYYMRAENEIKGCDYAESEGGKLPPYRVDTISVNSESHDGFPFILDQRQEDKFILFTSHRPFVMKGKTKEMKDPSSGEMSYSDLYMAIMENDSTFSSEIINVGSPINTPMNDGSATVTGDGLTMYFTVCQEGKSKGRECSVYESRYDYARKMWSKPERMQTINGTQQVVINSKGKTKSIPTNDRHPAISGDGMTMAFVSDRDGGKGGFDVWISHRTGDGWTQPENCISLLKVISAGGDKIYILLLYKMAFSKLL